MAAITRRRPDAHGGQTTCPCKQASRGESRKKLLRDTDAPQIRENNNRNSKNNNNKKPRSRDCGERWLVSRACFVRWHFFLDVFLSSFSLQLCLKDLCVFFFSCVYPLCVVGLFGSIVAPTLVAVCPVVRRRTPFSVFFPGLLGRESFRHARFVADFC